MILRMNATRRAGERRGAILLIVLTLLALFAVVALSFALYAESEALAARIRREAMSVASNPDPLPAANGFLQQMLYTPATDINNDTLSALRGHEMARLVYGGASGNNVPYNGIGTFAESLTLPTATGTVAVNRQQVVNYMNQLVRDAGGNPVPASQHIVDPEHMGYRNSTQFNTAINALPMPPTYVAKNAPYTYPDRNNMCVAVQDPNTGRIVLASYHRPTLFRNSTQPVGQSDLDQLNPNWTNDIGRYLILRPRPVDHTYNSGDGRGPVTDFPYPPMNPDGTYTGDVQNIVGTDGVQLNDAIWLNANLPVINWRGRNIIPLVAATVLPLDGRVNLNVAGNTKGTSTNGFGPWEVSLSQVTNPGDPTNILRSRTGSPAPSTPNARGTNLSSMPFLATALQSTQMYSSVNWDGSTVGSPMVMPMNFSSDPTYPAGFDSSTSGNIEDSQHPSLFNPFSWGSGGPPGQPKLFPHTDLRRAVTRYSGTQSDYNDPFFSATPQSPPTGLTGYGLQDPSNINRALVTTISNSLNRPGLMPNYRDYTARALTVSAAGQLVDATLAIEQQLTSTLVAPAGSPTNAITDFPNATAATITLLQSKVAALGAVDLNRPLADYRSDTNQSLAHATNVGTMAARFGQATIDRNNLAKEIFARLILATGAKAVVTNTASGVSILLPNPSTGYVVTSGTLTFTATVQDYDALRYLAQLSANIVDYIDNDDVSTPFVWNPDPAATMGLFDPLNFGPTAINDRVVFGVEKPRLVINEVYSEVTNDVADRGGMAANNNFKVRFFVELLNPSNSETVASTPLAGPDPAALGSVPLQFGTHSPYRIQVFDRGALVRSDLQLSNGNVLGNVTSAVAKVQADSNDLTNAGNPLLAQRVEPNNGAPSSAPPNRNGFAVVGPQVAPDTAMPPNEYVPADPSLLTGTATPLQYDINRTTEANLPMNVLNNVKDHAVVLRRLANPYLPESPFNPYITVDYMSYITANDGIRVVQGPVGLPLLGTRTMPGPTITRRSGIGRVQPYTGQETGPALPGNPPAPAFFPNSLTVGQSPTPAPMNQPQQTLFRHNGQTAGAMVSDSTIQLPFQWLTHLDRPLINQTELLTVSPFKPHELTHRFATPASPPNYHQHVAQWTTANVPLHRALELLGTKPRTYDTPFGGRVAGKINLNMVWDHRVVESLLDANASNGFINTDVYNTTLPADTTTTLWGKLISSRTPTWDVNNVPQPNATIDEGGMDRPFKSFGTASFASGGLLPGGSGLQDTILRSGMTPGTPAIFGGAGTHPYQKAEMLRKMQNNITTTTDTYMVVMTVGYFEVRNPGTINTGNPVVLGKEVFDEIPGDMRAKFCAVVDRSMLGVDANPVPPGTPTQVKDLWISETAVSSPPPAAGSATIQFRANGTNGTKIFVNYEGRVGEIMAGTKLIVGTGANAQLVTVSVIGFDINGNSTIDPNEIFDSNTGIATVTLTAVPAVAISAGTSISNATLANPGAQPNFDVNSPYYQGVVPYFGRIYPR